MKTSCRLLLFISFLFLIVRCEIEQPPLDKPNDPDCYVFDELETGTTISHGESFVTTILLAQKDDWAIDGSIEADSNNFVGNGKNIRLNNINMHMNLSSPTSQFSFDFAELGGSNKMVVNGISHNFTDFPELQNIIIDHVGFAVNATQAGNNWVGDITAQGPIESFAIGGQELWIDNLCTKRFNVLIENRRDDPGNNPLNPDGGLTQFNNLRELMTERGYHYAEQTEDSPALSTVYLNEFDLYIWYLQAISTVSMEDLSVIDSFVNQGGSVLILTESGNQMQFDNVEAVFNLFGAVHEGNTINHPTSNFNDLSSHVIYNSNNFLDAAVNLGVQQIYMPTGSSVSGTDASWVTVLESDAAATPPNRPLIIRRPYGNGKVMISGDFSFVMGAPINVGDGNMDNDLFIKNLLYHLVK